MQTGRRLRPLGPILWAWYRAKRAAAVAVAHALTVSVQAVPVPVRKTEFPIGRQPEDPCRHTR